MKKNEMIEFINDSFDWYERMIIGLGHHSWWYTNRSSDDCINVKIYAGVPSDELIDKLPDKYKKIVDTIGFDVEAWLTNYIYELIDFSRDDLEYDLKENFNVDHCEYGGRSGGWLAVVYDWDSIPDDYDDLDYSYSDIKEYYQMIKAAIKENSKVIAYVLAAKEALENNLNDVDNYLEPLIENIDQVLEYEQDKAKKILAIEGINNAI